MAETKLEKRGRPKVLDEQWAKVTFVLLNRQVVSLDQLAVDIRAETAKPVNRAEVLRELLDLTLKDPSVKAKLLDRFGSRRT